MACPHSTIPRCAPRQMRDTAVGLPVPRIARVGRLPLRRVSGAPDWAWLCEAAHSPVTFVQLVQDRQSSPVHVLEDLQLRFTKLLSGHVPDLYAVLLSSRLIRHSTQVHHEALSICSGCWGRCGRLVGKASINHSSRNLLLSTPHHPPRIPGHPGPIVRFCGRNFSDDPSRCQYKAVGSVRDQTR